MTNYDIFYEYFITYKGYKDYFTGLKNTAIIAVFGLVIGFLLGAIIATILLSVILLAVEFAATSILGAVITGLLLFSFFLTLTETACLTRCILINRD